VENIHELRTSSDLD